jgi:hypothetical protein
MTIAAPSVDDSPALKPLPTVLGIVAGSADVISFLGLRGLVVAHITGNLIILAAHVVTGGDRPVATQAREHDLELLLHGPTAVLLLLAQRTLLMVERPILSGAPDAIRDSSPPAARLRSRPATLTQYLSTTRRGADQRHSRYPPVSL